MPKEKKQKQLAIGQSTRHAPLGQVLQDDMNRGKYAPVRSKPRGGSKKTYSDNDESESHLLDEKTSRRILALSREQQLEMEAEERRERTRGAAAGGTVESSDEEEEVEDGGSIVMDGALEDDDDE